MEGVEKQRNCICSMPYLHQPLAEERLSHLISTVYDWEHWGQKGKATCPRSSSYYTGSPGWTRPACAKSHPVLLCHQLKGEKLLKWKPRCQLYRLWRKTLCYIIHVVTFLLFLYLSLISFCSTETSLFSLWITLQSEHKF